MRIAFCFSGQLRTAEYAAEGILRFIGDLFPSVDFFVHTWDQNQHRIRSYQSIKIYEMLKSLNLVNPKLIDKKIMLPHVAESTFSVLKKLDPIYKFQSIEVEKYKTCQTTFSKIYNHLQPHMYSWFKVNELKKMHEQTYKFTYDYVVRTRPDMLFTRDTTLAAEIKNCEKFPDAFFGQGGTASRLNDVFYISTSKTMDVAAQWMTNNHTKTHISEFMKNRGISSYTTLLSKCAIYRPECIPTRSTDYERCYNIDRDWYWTKNDTFRFNTSDE